MRSWPVISRSAHVDALVTALSARPARAQMLRGPSGIGKTTIAAAVSHTLGERGRTIVPVIALAELQHVPLGALAPLLGSSRFADIDDVGARLHELMALVGRHAESYLLVVDDAPLLDDASAAALYQLVRVFGVPCLMTARDEHALSGPIARLLHEDLVTVTETTGLSLDETRELLRRRLGADPRPESLQRLYETTRGNPLFLRELVMAAERAGRVSAGPFGVEVDAARLPGHIIDTVAGRIAELGERERALAELLAVAQPWPPAATRDDERDALDALVSAGIVASSGTDDAGYLQLAHPVFAEALLAGLDSAARAARRRDAADRLLALGAPELRFTALCLRDDAGDALALDDLVWASGYAHAVGDHERAVRAARRAIDRVGEDAALATRARAHLALGAALSALGELDEADAAFAAADDAALAAGDVAPDHPDPGLRAAVQLRWAQHTALRRTAPRDAAERLTSVLADLDAEGRALVEPDLAKWRLMAGDTGAVPVGASADRAASPSASAGPGLDAAAPGVPAGPAALNAAIGQAMIATMSGRTAEAAAAVAAGRPLAAQHADVLPFADSLLDLNAFLIDVGDGRIAEARAFAEARRLDPFADSAGLWSYALALIHLHAGRLHDAEPLARLAIEQLRWRDFTGLLGPAIALAATVAAQLGEPTEAEALLAQLDAAHLDDVKVTLQAAEARAWLAADDPARAIGEIGAAVARGAELGHLLLTALTASVGIRAGGAAAFADPLAGMAAYSGCTLVTTLAETAAAWRDANASAAIELAPRIQSMGLDALALDTVRAALDWAGGERMLERRARVLATELALTVVTPRRGRDAREQTGLTEREWVIARAAARRERSREIAERLGVSVRTVDNHLASVYRKLGVGGRAELEDELRDFL
ncbi:NACHT domain-containing protein [Microcella putealis]|uniref:NACHT domain-containing protein n=1 Tax=Microcella putealis TaxID=337005 RepID=A0A4Q7LPI5_9MICO|nr:LuxR family transcriptional regulator [Microcella putealis]RZS56152.1 NACHT domain-containing protein [Microcella putealis]TQM23417.1 NACHT domain-containing protein [Microcella putealis]